MFGFYIPAAPYGLSSFTHQQLPAQKYYQNGKNGNRKIFIVTVIFGIRQSDQLKEWGKKRSTPSADRQDSLLWNKKKTTQLTPAFWTTSQSAQEAPQKGEEGEASRGWRNNTSLLQPSNSSTSATTNIPSLPHTLMASLSKGTETVLSPDRFSTRPSRVLKLVPRKLRRDDQSDSNDFFYDERMMLLVLAIVK